MAKPPAPLRVLHAAETVKGGVATVMRLNALAQTAELGGGNVHCLVPADQSEELVPLAPEQIKTFRRTGRNPLSLLRFAVSLGRAVIAEKPEIVHLHSTFAGVMGRLTLLLLRPVCAPKIVYTPHAWAFLMEGSPRRKKLYATVEKLLYPLTTRIICVSDYEKAEALRYGLPGAKLVRIYNGVPEPSPVRGPSPFKGEGPHLLFVGRFDYQKGFDVLLEAMKLLEGTPAHLTAVGAPVHAGETPPERPNITYTGWLKPEQLAPYFAHATVLVMPSRWESFGLVAAEAASYGLPAIVSNCCSLPEVVVAGEGGELFDPGDVRDLARIISTTDGREWAMRGKKARERARGLFSSDKMSKETQDIYRGLLLC